MYRNTVRQFYNTSSGGITRSEEHHIPVYCIHERAKSVQGAFQPEAQTVAVQSAQHNFDVSVRFFMNSSFDGDGIQVFPVVVTLGGLTRSWLLQCQIFQVPLCPPGRQRQIKWFIFTFLLVFTPVSHNISMFEPESIWQVPSYVQNPKIALSHFCFGDLMNVTSLGNTILHCVILKLY